MSSYVPCTKNNASGYIFYVSLVSQADTKIMQANPTLAAGDVQIAVDDAAPGNLGTLPVVDGDFTKRVKVTLSQGETNGDNLTIIFSDAAGAEWCDLTINIQTSAQTLDEIDTLIDTLIARLTAARAGYLDNLSAGAVALASALATAQTDLDNPNQYKADVSNLDVAVSTRAPESGGNVAAIKAKTDLIGASVALESGGNLAAVKAKTDLIPADITTQLDTNIPAIKAKTDIIPADIATQLDTNIPAIRVKTDNLPTDPADESLLEAVISLAVAAIRGTDSDTLKDLSDQLDTAQTDLDNPSQYKADVSGLALEATAQSIKAQTDKFLFDVSSFVKSIAQNSELAHLDADISSVTAEVDNLITRAKGLNEIYDSVALRALEATLTTIKQKVAGTFNRETDSLEAIRDRGDDAWVTGVAATPKANFTA